MHEMSDGGFDSYRLSRPFRYSAIAAVIAGAVAFAADIWLFGHPVSHAWKSAAAAAASWGLVLLFLTTFVRFKENSRH